MSSSIVPLPVLWLEGERQDTANWTCTSVVDSVECGFYQDTTLKSCDALLASAVTMHGLLVSSRLNQIW